ncbi:amino acid adenylation domain-containing protein [Micromonospora sp. NPDC000663]|uniref:non-ribosomal peptide synthetase n=1 Tax=Micromonospora sp. NPDC000663 TaxID=3364218 RepID=UPI0036B30672
MTTPLSPSPTRIRPRLTAPPAPGRVRSSLSLSAPAAEGLARMSSGRPGRETTVLAAATALVVAAAENTATPTVVVATAAGPVPLQVDLGASPMTVEALVDTAATTLHAAATGTVGRSAGGGHVLVRSGPADAASTAAGSAAIEVVLTPDRLVAEADATWVEEWFLAVLLRAVSATLAAFVERSRRLDAVPVAAEEDLERCREYGWDRFVPQPTRTTLTAAIAARVEESPERVAVVVGTETLTYAAMWGAAQRVAERLVGLGVGAGDRVAVLTGKTLPALPAILGVLLVRAAYVPLDPQSPASRLKAILADASCRAVLSADGLAEGLIGPPLEVEVLDVRRIVDESEAPSSTVTTPGPVADDPAYVIYTSGSSGVPKGVQVRHGAVAGYVRWKVDYDRLDGDARVLQVPSLAFDSSVSDIFPALAAGGRIVLVDAQHLSLRRLAEVVSEEQISHMTVVPSLYRLWLDELAPVASSLRVVTVAGEATDDSLVRRHHQALPGVRLVNEYGPTENSVCATAFDQGIDSGPGCPIGRPLPNTVVAVVGWDDRARPPGFVGELRLTGHGLADGYHNRQELTRQAFVPDSAAPGGRWYRTGDLGWWRPDGTVEFAGRADDQVKIRGHRVELGEIESALTGMAGVRAAAVVAAPGQDGAPAIVAYVESAVLSVDDIHAAVADLLPPAMVPSRFELRPRLPRLVSGKLDRQALVGLSEDPAETSTVPEATADRWADEVEETVADVFGSVLGRQPTGPEDDFFVLGGHSLAAMSAIAKLEQRLLVTVDLGAFFDHPTIRAVSGLVRAEQASRGARPAPPAPVRPVGNSDALLRLLERGSGS